MEEDVESELSFAPTTIYDSPPMSPRRLSDLDLTLTAKVNSADVINVVQGERFCDLDLTVMAAIFQCLVTYIDNKNIV